MSNYVQSTNFATKDNLSSGDPLKIVKGTEINTEFANIAIAVATKADLASPTFTGTPAAPTAASGTNTTQIATTAFVTTAITSLNADNITSGDLAVANGGTGATTAADARTNLDVPSRSGSGASGTWSISISGNAATATSATSATTATTATTANNAIGVGQTWQDVTSSRSMGTTYTNSTGRSIMVNIRVSNTSYGTSVLTVAGLEVGRVSNPTTSNGAEATLSAIVPNGVSYSVSGYMVGWYELR